MGARFLVPVGLLVILASLGFLIGTPMQSLMRLLRSGPVGQGTNSSRDEDARGCHSIQRVVMVVFSRDWKFFEDWLAPLLSALELSTCTARIDASAADLTGLVRRTVRTGDVVLVVQQPHITPKDVPGTDVWFINTEGQDKNFSRRALRAGFTKVIDYSLAGLMRHQKDGWERILWLPIVTAPTLPVFARRTFLCLVGGANRPRRKAFWGQLKGEAQKRKLQIPFREVLGWKEARDVLSQECLLVVNLRSIESNTIMPRLRLDVLWLYNIYWISEEMEKADENEYQKTVTFASRPQLVNATLQLWAQINRNLPPPAISIRMQVQKARLQHFQAVVHALLKRNCSFGRERTGA
jgi:hypothetical protein